MFKTIMVPVDVSHADSLGRALDVACDLGGRYGADVYLVEVSSAVPGAAAHSPNELTGKLDKLAESLGARHKANVHGKTVISSDPAVELDDKLIDTARDLGADLVVMASHKPGLLENFFHTHAVDFAAHADISVFIVR